MNGKIFVFEGVDRSGKTTLIKKVHDYFGFEIISVDRPAENGWEASEEWTQGKIDFELILGMARENAKTSYLMDRFSYSELVYCRAFNRKCDFAWYETKIQENRDKLKLILVDENLGVLQERWSKENKPLKNLYRLIDEYAKLPRELNLVETKDFIRVLPRSEIDIALLIKWINDQIIV